MCIKFGAEFSAVFIVAVVLYETHFISLSVNSASVFISDEYFTLRPLGDLRNIILLLILLFPGIKYTGYPVITDENFTRLYYYLQSSSLMCLAITEIKVIF